jgi:hypothetical protein
MKNNIEKIQSVAKDLDGELLSKDYHWSKKLCWKCNICNKVTNRTWHKVQGAIKKGLSFCVHCNTKNGYKKYTKVMKERKGSTIGSIRVTAVEYQIEIKTKTKKCSICKVFKEWEKFAKVKRCRHSLSSECKECRNVIRRNKEKTPIQKINELLNGCKKRSLRKDIPFDLDIVWAMQRFTNCEVTNIPFDISPSKNKSRTNPFAPTIDRINPDGGYTKENCRIVCWIYNLSKSNWGDKEVKIMAEALVNQ